MRKEAWLSYAVQGNLNLILRGEISIFTCVPKFIEDFLWLCLILKFCNRVRSSGHSASSFTNFIIIWITEGFANLTCKQKEDSHVATYVSSPVSTAAAAATGTAATAVALRTAATAVASRTATTAAIEVLKKEVDFVLNFEVKRKNTNIYSAHCI